MITNFLRSLLGESKAGPTPLIFGLKRSSEDQMLFMGDCAAATNGRGFSHNWGDRFLDGDDAVEPRSVRGQRKEKTRKLYRRTVGAQQDAGFESRDFRKRLRRDELTEEETERMTALGIAYGGFLAAAAP